MQFESSLILEPLPARLAGLWGAHVCRAHVPSGVRGLGEVDLALCASCSAVWLEAQEVGIVRFTCMHLHTLRNRRLKHQTQSVKLNNIFMLLATQEKSAPIILGQYQGLPLKDQNEIDTTLRILIFLCLQF